MSGEESCTAPAAVEFQPQNSPGGYNVKTAVYHSLIQLDEAPIISTRQDLNTATFVLSQFPTAESRVALIDSVTSSRVTYGQLSVSIRSLACGLYHALGVRKGDVVFVLSANSVLYPVICLAVMSIGAVITTANPINTASEIGKQVRDSGAKLAVSAPEELHKLSPTGIPTILTTRSSYGDTLSVEELIESCSESFEPLPKIEVTQSDPAAILYSSGTTGTSKGVVLTHSNIISVIELLTWCVDSTSSQHDVFLCFIPMFHIYGLVFFGLGLFCRGITTVLMQRFNFQSMIAAIEKHKINNIPAVPPVILGLVKSGDGSDFSSLRRVGSGAAPLGKDVEEAFREKFPWVELRPGYGLTESTGAATWMITDKDAKAHPGSCGMLMPSFFAKIVDVETGEGVAPMKEGELWLKSPTIMKGYLGNKEATEATIDEEGWLKTGDLGYIDEDGFLYIVDRIKELIKHNGYQVAPAELETILLSHTEILDAAVIPMEDEAAGQIPVACVVKAPTSKLTEEQVIQFVASQVAAYKKVRGVRFISSIPRSLAGKILRKDLVSQFKQQQLLSKL
ncbi:4-coumarate--CoA ligase-like 5 [Benincasa hispida]|uniref:4-coumarate--CoA ligase-like 5 n=1 Tax=Benincasa hispida TaxID=102211 RepID=UPI0019002B4C|nr:4-coumarate--CoA ligase-like 5 [Benincasa hispida]